MVRSDPKTDAMTDPDLKETTLNTLHQDRLQEKRFTQFDLRIREQHLELQNVLRGIGEGVRALLDGQRVLHEDIRSLSADIKALIARLDALIKGRGDGFPTA